MPRNRVEEARAALRNARPDDAVELLLQEVADLAFTVRQLTRGTENRLGELEGKVSRLDGVYGA